MPAGVLEFLSRVRSASLMDTIVQSVLSNKRLSGAIVHSWLAKHGYTLEKIGGEN